MELVEAGFVALVGGSCATTRLLLHIVKSRMIQHRQTMTSDDDVVPVEKEAVNRTMGKEMNTVQC